MTGLQNVFEAVATLLGASDTHQNAARKVIVPDKLTGINLERVSWAQFRRAQSLALHPQFKEDFIATLCLPAAPLVTWCRAILAFLARTRFAGRPEVHPAVLSFVPPDGLLEEIRQQRREQPESAQAAQGAVQPEGDPATSVQSMSSAPTEGRPCTGRSDGSTTAEDVSSNAAVDLTRASSPPLPSPSARSSTLVITPDVRRLAKNALKQVKDLTVSRPEIGSIVFHGITDCSDLDIPALVHLDVGEVLVYPVPGTKPVVGHGLNRRSTVTMYQCWPPNGRGYLEDERAQERYRWKIQQMTEEKKAKFIDYDCQTGVWKFQVEHF